MENALLGLAALACPVGMGVMMWFMGRGMRSKGEPESLEALRVEHARLGREIEQLQGDSELSGTRT